MFNWLVQNAIGQIPMYVWAFVAGIGVGIHFLTVFLARVPQIKPYALILRVISMVATWVGVFMCGSAGVSEIWQQQLQLAEQKIEIAQQQSKQVNTRIITKVVKQTEYITVRTNNVEKQIQQDKQVLDKDCRVPAEFVSIHNKAAEPAK